MQTVLVTGGAGFIGVNFVRQWLAEEPGRLVNLDKLTYAGNLDSLGEALNNPRHVFIGGDMGDSRLVGAVLDEYQPQTIVNLAAESHVGRSIDAPLDFVQTNVVGTFGLLETVRRYWLRLDEEQRRSFRFLHVSTDEVYGSLGPQGKFTETSPYAPNSPYSASKAAGDHFVRAYHRTYGLPVVTTVCANNFGPYQFPEKLIPLMILNALEGRPLPLYGDGRQVRDWVYVEDHCRALRAALAAGEPGAVYHIGGDQERTNLEVVQAICSLVDWLCPDLPHRPCSQLIRFVADRPGHDQRYALDWEKTRQQLGWQPRDDFRSGLERTVRWYLERGDWVQRVSSGKYQRERLGLGERGVIP